MMVRLPILFILLLATLIATGIGSKVSMAATADEAASVVLSIGKNTAQLPDQASRALKRKSVIYTEDLITTGSKGQLQLRFTDGSRFSLRPETLFRVDEYQFSKQTPEQGKSVYRLLKGGLRTITGAISDANVDHYQVKTPIATIGVRGTHYTLFYCDRSCKEATRSKIGLYGYVLEGEIVLANDSINVPIQKGRYFFLGGDGSSLTIKETPFDLFEKLKGLGPDLVDDVSGGNIPALDVMNSPSVVSPQTDTSPQMPDLPSRGPTNNN